MEPRKLSPQDEKILMETLQLRFINQSSLHQGMNWDQIQVKLQNNPQGLRSLWQMESTGGEPDVLDSLHDSDQYLFVDTCKESPAGRRSLCYDQKALDSRKENKPRGCVEEMAKSMGIELLDETHYRYLQSKKTVDTKTSSWIQTPQHIRTLGGALFCDYRYATTFIYHNGADSYYSARGFRGMVRI